MNINTTSTIIAVALCLFSGVVKADNDYMVEKGDSLIKIGKLFGVPYKEIMRVNNLKNTTIFPDQILRIPSAGKLTEEDRAILAQAKAQAAESAPTQATTQSQPQPAEVARVNVPGYSDIATPTVSREEASYTQTAYIPPVQGASKARPTGTRELETYTVREGDTIWNISRRFGVDAVELKKVNNIKFSTIQIGQVLTLPNKVSIAAN